MCMYLFILTVYFYLQFLCKSDFVHFLLIRNNGDFHRNKHFLKLKKDDIINIFEQIKVSREP